MFGVGARAWLAAFPVFVQLPWHCSLVAPPERPGTERSAVDGKQEVAAHRIASVAPPAAPASRVRAVTLPDEVVVKAVGVGQPAFLRCWARAQRSDSPPSSTKVHLHVELDAAGKVTAIQTDSDSPALSRCLAVVARQLPFPAPGTRAVVNLPLLFP
jgi:hypothetical protein